MILQCTTNTRKVTCILSTLIYFFDFLQFFFKSHHLQMQVVEFLTAPLFALSPASTTPFHIIQQLAKNITKHKNISKFAHIQTTKHDFQSWFCFFPRTAEEGKLYFIKVLIVATELWRCDCFSSCCLTTALLSLVAA